MVDEKYRHDAVRFSGTGWRRQSHLSKTDTEKLKLFSDRSGMFSPERKNLNEFYYGEPRKNSANATEYDVSDDFALRY